MSDHTEVPCPCCGGTILVEASMLLKGSTFNCSTEACDAAISLSHSSYQVTGDALDKLNEIKSISM